MECHFALTSQSKSNIKILVFFRKKILFILALLYHWQGRIKCDNYWCASILKSLQLKSFLMLFIIVNQLFLFLTFEKYRFFNCVKRKKTSSQDTYLYLCLKSAFTFDKAEKTNLEHSQTTNFGFFRARSVPQMNV